MDNAMNQQTIVEHIDLYLEDGLPVFDANNDRVGTVKMFSEAAGYLMVEYGGLERKDLYIPFRLIRTIDPKEIYLSEMKDSLIAQYTQPPRISTISEERLVPDEDGFLKAKRQDVQLVQSGYDNLTRSVHSVDTKKVGKRVAVGMVVYDAKGERLGDITQYDTTRNLMTIEKGLFKPRVLVVPFSAIENVDSDMFTVSLNLPRDVVVKEHTMLFPDA